MTSTIAVMCVSTAATADSQRRISVATVPQLQAAIRTAQAGDLILIAPGRYRTKLRFTAEASGNEAAPITVTASDGPGTVVIDGAGAEITIKFSGATYIKLKALDVTGGGKHGIFFDKGAHDITVDGNRIYDNHADYPMNSHAEVKGSGGKNGRTRKITISNNEIFHSTHPPGGNFQGIDCNFCENYRIVGNYLHDIREPTIEPTSHYDRGSCIQMKSNSRNTVIERNQISRCHIGIVFGGEGMASPEHFGGSVRNNLITDSSEIGIAIVNAVGGEVSHNTLVGGADSIRIAPDIRFPDGKSDTNVTNNILNNPVRRTPGQTSTMRGNVIVTGDNANDVFRAPSKGDFRLRDSASSLIDLAAKQDRPVTDDFDGELRPYGKNSDVGAFEYRPNK